MEQERAAVAVDAAESQQQEANNSQKNGCAGIVKKLNGLCSWSNLVLVVIIIAVATLMSFTVIVFYLPRNDKLNVDLDPLSCSAQPYTGSVCLQELQDWQNCLPERRNDSAVFVPSDIDLETRENEAELLFTTGLPLLQASEHCIAESRSYFCLLLFALCDGSGRKRLPSREECIYVQENICAAEIQRASEIELFASVIQDCDLFQFNTPACKNESAMLSRPPVNITCSDQFYFDESSQVCKPECGVWTQHSHLTANLIRSLFIVGDVGGVLFSTTVLVVSFFQRKRVFKFPTVIIVYYSMALLIMSFFDIFQYSTPEVVCPFKDLTESLKVENTTPYCNFLGVFIFFIVMLVTCMWLTQTSIFFWGVSWPIHHQFYKKTGKIRYVHIIAMTFCVLLSLISVLAMQFSEGYGVSIIAYYHCESRGANDTFYAVILMICIMLSIGVLMLIIIIWKLADVKKRCSKGVKHKKRQVQTAEIKVMIILFYYFFLAFYNITVATIAVWRAKAFENVVTEHFACEALGSLSTEVCTKDGFVQFAFDSFANPIHYVVFCSTPAVFFVYLVDLRKMRKLCCTSTRKRTESIVSIRFRAQSSVSAVSSPINSPMTSY